MSSSSKKAELFVNSRWVETVSLENKTLLKRFLRSLLDEQVRIAVTEMLRFPCGFQNVLLGDLVHGHSQLRLYEASLKYFSSVFSYFKRASVKLKAIFFFSDLNKWHLPKPGPKHAGSSNYFTLHRPRYRNCFKVTDSISACVEAVQR